MTAMTPAKAAAPALPSVEDRVRVPLKDLGLAPENLRADEPADEAVPRLAETIRAAGLIYPPLVRRGRKGEAPFMVLDGRRRRFALLLLAEAGVLAPDHEVECILVRDRAAQAAAAVLPNAEHAPVHLADVILAIGRLRKARMTTRAVAEALGYEELEIRRLEALARVEPVVIEAFRAGRLTLRQVRMFARVKDRAQQAELARAALDGYFHDYQLQSLAQEGRVTAADPRFGLVGAARYAEAGGRLREDLFGELPAEVLDVKVLEATWRTCAAEVAAGLVEAGLTVYLGRDRGYRAPDGLFSLPFVHWGSLDDEARAVFDAARERIEAAVAAVEATEPGAGRDGVLGEVLAARLALARLTAGRSEVKAVLLAPAADGLDAIFYLQPLAEAEGEDQDHRCDGGGDDRPDEEDREDDEDRAPPRAEIEPAEVTVEVAGVSHVQHAARTDIATRGLIRDLADRPDAALVALVAQLFKHLALAGAGYADASALRISATRYGPASACVPALDGEVRARLDARRDDYLASGLRPLGWVASLTGDDRMALLAELTAASLDLHEPRADRVRREARAEAAEIAALCGADLAARWTPDAAFLGVHGKGQLTGFLADMAACEKRHASLKKDELTAAVATAAAERGWVPAFLRWPHQSPGETGAAKETRAA